MNKSTLWPAIILLAGSIFITDSASAQMRSGKFGVGAEGSLYLFNSNMADGLMKGGGGVTLSYSAMEHLGLRAMFGMGQLGYKNASNAFTNTTTLLTGNLYVSYDMIPHGTFNPFLFVGVGGIYFDPRSDKGNYLVANTSVAKTDINYLGGIGFDYFFSEFVSLTLSGEFALTNTTALDMGKHLGTNNTYSRVNLEFRYYFFDQDYVTKLIQALQARYKAK